MTRCFLTILSFFSLQLVAISQTADVQGNISIQSQREEIEFIKGDKVHPVLVRRIIETSYVCNNFRTHFTVAELFTEQESVDDVTVYINGERDRSIVPKTDYYSSTDIFYSDARMVYLELPMEKKGTVCKVVFVKTIKDPRFFTQVFFTDNYPITKKEVVIKVPSWMDAEFREYNLDAKQFQKTTDRSDPSKTIYHYTGNNVEPRKDEPDAPGPTFIYPHLLALCKQAKPGDQTITYFSNSAEQYKWYRTLVLQMGNDPVPIKAKAVEITKGINDDLSRVKAIYYWVQDNIRYIAFENGIAGFKPSPAQDVLEKKYGDCKGMANLTKELLVSLGYDARLCWIGTSHIVYDSATPSLCLHNHMICALYYKGSKYFLDATEKNIDFNHYAERIQGRQVMIENGDQFTLDRVPVTTFTQNTEIETRKLAIDGTTLKGTAEHSYAGESKEGILSGIESIKKDNLEPALRDYLSEGSKDYKLSDLAISHAEQDGEPLELKYNVVHNNAVSRFGNEMYIELDFRKELANMKMDTSKRTQDYMMPYKMHLVTETILDIPTGYHPTNVPAPFHYKHPDFEMNLSYITQNGKLVYRKEIDFMQVRIGKKEFGKLNEAIDGLNRFYNAQITLTK